MMCCLAGLRSVHFARIVRNVSEMGQARHCALIIRYELEWINDRRWRVTEPAVILPSHVAGSLENTAPTTTSRAET